MTLETRHLILTIIGMMFGIGLQEARCEEHRTRSLALKDTVQIWHGYYEIHRDESAHDLWNAFMLVHNANDGDALAQHELGLRYLLGDGFKADTLKAAALIQKAAAKNVYPAKYNYGILLNNGWGVAWNPFEAYRQFHDAAVYGMAEAEYVVGMFMTDNLVVPRNYSQAFRWIKKAADDGYQPAQQAVIEFHRRGLDKRIDGPSHSEKNAGNGSSSPSSGVIANIQPLYLDTANESITSVDDSILVNDALREKIFTSSKANPAQNTVIQDWKPYLDSVRIAAKAGSPEALTLLGRWCEEGNGLPKDRLEATVYYLQAFHCDGPWALLLLSKLMQSDGYFTELHEAANKGDVRALFAWAEFVALDIDHQITEEQALTFLRRAAEEKFSFATMELALCYYNGRWVPMQKEKARVLFEKAVSEGNEEGSLRLAMMALTGNHPSAKYHEPMKLLATSAANGSVLAESMLGYCYEHGIGAPLSISKAVHFYRDAAERGSRTGYNSLRALYNKHRPKDSEFQIQD